LLGNKKTPLTLISRDKLHQVIARIIETGCQKPVYLMFENNASTKREYLQKKGYKLIVPLNKFLVVTAAKILKTARVFKPSHLEQVRSLFRETAYCCYQTEYTLGMSFIPNSFCIIGTGTYGSYVAHKIREAYPGAHITMFDVGNEKVKNEDEIGYKTNILKGTYIGTSKGRFFGFGGASTKWGGQLLTFSENDFKSPSGLLKDIVKIDQKHRDAVFKKFNIENGFKEKVLNDGMFIKNRDLARVFQKEPVQVFQGAGHQKPYHCQACPCGEVLAFQQACAWVGIHSGR
jgi:hypothetical protein